MVDATTLAGKMRSAWHWARDNAAALLGGLAALLAVAWGIHYARRRAGGLSDRVAVESARREIAALTARRDALTEHSDEREPEVAEIDTALAINRRRIVEAHVGTGDMSSDEVEREYAGLGY